MKIKEKNFVRDNYQEAFNFLVESKNYIYFAIWIFIFFIILGIVFPSFGETWALRIIKDLVDRTKGFGFFDEFKFIFFNNVQSSFVSLFFGLFFSIVPVFNAIVNGYLIGYVVQFSVAKAGIGVLWRLFPHGIFELPALFISLGLGLKLGTFFFYAKEKARGFFAFLVSLLVFLFLFIWGLAITVLIKLGPDILKNSKIPELALFNSPQIFIILIILIAISFCLSLFVGLSILSFRDRVFVSKIFSKNFWESIRVFFLIVVPLLLIAGIIEAGLVFFIR